MYTERRPLAGISLCQEVASGFCKRFKNVKFDVQIVIDVDTIEKNQEELDFEDWCLFNDPQPA